MHYSIPQIAQFWESNGGDPAFVVIAVAVALAESGGESTAHSDTDDWGLWQINGVHFGEHGITQSNVFDPNVNAAGAVWISSGGQNWAPWATCYANINATGWVSYKASPDPGSAAYAHLSEVSAGIGIPIPPSPGPITSGCGPHDVGIPNAVVAGLAPGEVRHVHTCPGGSFDAGGLMPGLTVEGYNAAGIFAVTSNYPGFMIPGNIDVSIYLSGTVGAAPGVPAQPSPVIPQPTNPIPAGCAAGDVGIPNVLLAGLGIDQSVTVTTCPGGDFDAAGLQSGLRVSGWKNGAPFIVTSGSHGFMIPRSTVVVVTRYDASGGSPTPPQPSPVPPVYVPPAGPLPTGSGRNQMQTVWVELANFFNDAAPFIVTDLTNARAYFRSIGT